MTSARVSFTGGTYRSGEDVLSLGGDGSYGNITGSFDNTTGTLTLTSSGNTATAAQWQAALDAVSYDDTAASPNTTPRSFNFTVTDSNALTSTAVAETMAVTHTDQTPDVTTSASSIDYVTNAAAVTIDGSVSVSDADNTTQSSATASITGGFHSGDALAFANTNSTTYGNIGASYNSATGVLTLTSSGATATDTQWANALSAVTFSATSAGNRTVSFVSSDGTKNSLPATDAVTVIGTPVITADSGSAAFVAGDNVTSTPVVVDNGGSLAVTDPSSSTLRSATVSITANFHSGEDVLAFTNTSSVIYGDVSGSYNVATGILTLTSPGGAPLAQWNNALEAVTYTDTAVTPNDANRTISFSVVDGNGNGSNTATRTVTVTATDQTPVVSTTTAAAGSVSYVPGLTPVTLDGGIVVTDRGNTALASATISISGGFQPGDQLSFTPGSGSQDGNITASYDAATGVLTLRSSGATATLTQWQAAMNSIGFSTLPTTSPETRTISFVVNDGTRLSAAVTTTVSLVARPYAPPVVEISQGALGAADQPAVLPATREPVSLTVLSELDPQPTPDGISGSSLNGGLLGLTNDGSSTKSGIDIPTWLQRGSTATEQATERTDIAPGQVFSINLTTPSARHEGGMRHIPAEIVVRQADGQPLPGWMHYDAATGVLNGTAPDGARHEMRIVVTRRDSAGHVTRREIVIDFGGSAAPSVHEGSPRAFAPVSKPTPLASKPSLAEQFARQRAALHVSRHPQTMRFRRNA
jgi:hypothetical protein